MHYWIDGYNFFFRLTKNYKSMKEQEKSLLEKLYQTMTQLDSPMTVVFDGREKDPPEALRRNLKSMNIVYTPVNQTADDYILEMLEHTKNPAQEMVISSDRDLLRRSKQKGARTQTIEEFIHKVAHKKTTAVQEKKRTKESSQEFARLLKLFEEKL
ncbi:MAG: NYN domain-containing protein [Rhabdochlamydiaceae bacterium]|nr:NYN domain-containing protein [Rhabdochlamydiaceae bacterium]